MTLFSRTRKTTTITNHGSGGPQLSAPIDISLKFLECTPETHRTSPQYDKLKGGPYESPQYVERREPIRQPMYFFSVGNILEVSFHMIDY